MSKFRNFERSGSPLAMSKLFTDFHTYATADWVLTTVEAGAGNASEALAAAANGVLVVTNDAADNDYDAFQWAGGTGAVVESFKYDATKKLQFAARFKVSDADQTDLMLGLYITDTDPVGGVSDGIYFRVADGDASISLVVEKNATETVVDTGVDLADDTYVAVEWYYDGGGQRIMAFVNDVHVCSAPLTNAPDDEELALSFAAQNGEAVAKVLSIDYIGAAQAR